MNIFTLEHRIEIFYRIEVFDVLIGKKRVFQLFPIVNDIMLTTSLENKLISSSKAF